MVVPHLSRSRARSTDVRLLAELWRSWFGAGQRMPADLWTRPVGLGDWTVRELYAHVGKGAGTLRDLVSRQPIHGEPDLPDAAAYFAALRPLGAAGAAQVAQAATEWAAGRSNDVLVNDFEAPVPDMDGQSVVLSIAGTIRLADYLVTRILEATVHLQDLGQVVPDVTVPPEALYRVVDVLADLCPPEEFVRLATGRPAKVIFPVLT
jgi:uncharacterized protein (TIGR03083 family)